MMSLFSSVASGRHPVVTPGRWLWLAAQVVGLVRTVVLVAGLVMLASALTTARASYPGVLLLGALAVAVVDRLVLRRAHGTMVRRAWWSTTGGVGSPPLFISVATPEDACEAVDGARALQVTRAPDIVSMLVRSLVVAAVAWVVVPLVPVEIGASVAGPAPALAFAPGTVMTVVLVWGVVSDYRVDVRLGVGSVARLVGGCVLVVGSWVGPLVGAWAGAVLAGVPAADEVYARFLFAFGAVVMMVWPGGRLVWCQVRSRPPVDPAGRAGAAGIGHGLG